MAPTAPMARLLIIEDNENLASGVSRYLETEGHEVEVAPDGATGIERAQAWRPELVILDLMLPGVDGYAVLRQLRGQGMEMPILLLTARAEEADKVLGFRLGADDYVTKPFGLSELTARITALLRRSRMLAPAGGPATPTGSLAVPAAAHPAIVAGELAPVDRFGDVEVDVAARVVLRRGAPVELTPKTFDLLLALLRRHGAVGGRLELLQEVWGYTSDIMTRTLDIHVVGLRRALEDDPANPRHVLTVRKVGYRLRR